MDTLWPPTWPKEAEPHVFDPEGDVLLILDRFALEGDLLKSKSKSKTKSKNIQGDSMASESQESGWPEPEGESESLLFEPESSAKPDAKQVQMRVSSRHLILASATFRTSLASDTYPEGRILKTEGNVVIPLPDEDPGAMIILLNIIHGLSSAVPRRVDLIMLSKIAVTVNHRKMHQVVELWSDTWIENLKKDEGLPGSYIPEKLLPWLFIFWVFGKDKDFREISQRLGYECDHSLEDDSKKFPYIPASIIRSVQENRMNAIESMIAVIHDLITKYSGPEILCDNGAHFACDSKVLGSLLKSAAIIKIWPRPENHYPGINAKTLLDQILAMKILDSCDGEGNYYSAGRSHGIQDSIKASMKSLQDSISGLHLTAFLPETAQWSRGNKKKKKPSMKVRTIWEEL